MYFSSYDNAIAVIGFHPWLVHLFFFLVAISPAIIVIKKKLDQRRFDRYMNISDIDDN